MLFLGRSISIFLRDDFSPIIVVTNSADMLVQRQSRLLLPLMPYAAVFIVRHKASAARVPRAMIAP